MEQTDLKSLCEKEKQRTEFALNEVSLTEKDKKSAEDLLNLIKSYFKDALYFYEKENFLESFELFSYLWGLLDAGARLNLFNPNNAKKHFKIEQ